jgi:hypothetical protein
MTSSNRPTYRRPLRSGSPEDLLDQPEITEPTLVYNQRGVPGSGVGQRRRHRGMMHRIGDAALPAALFDDFNGPAELVLHLGGATRYPLFGAADWHAAA